MDGLSCRESLAEKATIIIEQELETFNRSRCRRDAFPIINKLRDHLASIRSKALVVSDGDSERDTHLLAASLFHDSRVVLEETAVYFENPTEFSIIESVLEKLFKLNHKSYYFCKDEVTKGDQPSGVRIEP